MIEHSVACCGCQIPGDAGGTLPLVDGGESVLAFERFYRADNSRSRRSGGSGLGLSIVHATVSALSGHVELISDESTGTTARIELPLARPSTDDGS